MSGLFLFLFARVKLFCMPRTKRVCPAGEVFHVLNRGVARLDFCEKEEDFDAFMRVVNETWNVVPLPIFAMVLMSNHWHFVVRPETDDQVSEFFRRLTVTHTMRWHSHYQTGGTGHLYQGRFKSFPIQQDEHLLTVNEEKGTGSIVFGTGLMGEWLS